MADPVNAAVHGPYEDAIIAGFHAYWQAHRWSISRTEGCNLARLDRLLEAFQWSN